MITYTSEILSQPPGSVIVWDPLADAHLADDICHDMTVIVHCRQSAETRLSVKSSPSASAGHEALLWPQGASPGLHQDPGTPLPYAYSPHSNPSNGPYQGMLVVPDRSMGTPDRSHTLMSLPSLDRLSQTVQSNCVIALILTFDRTRSQCSCKDGSGNTSK